MQLTKRYLYNTTGTFLWKKKVLNLSELHFFEVTCFGDVLKVVDVLVQVLSAFDPDIWVGCDVISRPFPFASHHDLSAEAIVEWE